MYKRKNRKFWSWFLMLTSFLCDYIIVKTRSGYVSNVMSHGVNSSTQQTFFMFATFVYKWEIWTHWT